MRASRLLFFFAFLFLFGLSGLAQKTKPVQKPKTALPKKEVAPVKKITEAVAAAPSNQKEKVRDMMKFFEYLINTLGSESTSTRDKEVIVKESYLKIFRDNHVQVEDDLDDKREVTTNKDITAYLKDVDFFFTDVKFEFKIDTIVESGSLEDVLYYKVSLTRELHGVNSDGKTMINSTPRFIEVNYDPKNQDLKIVSIYTHAFDEKTLLQNWWQQLSTEWQKVFKQKIGKQEKDSMAVAEIKSVTLLRELDISNNVFIQNLEPITKLTALNKINISGVPVINLNPLRNHTELTELKMAGTRITDLSILKYASKLETLDASHTSVSDISVLQNLSGLQSLKLMDTHVSDISSLGSLSQLQELNLASALVNDLTALSSLSKLAVLNLSNTTVTDVSALSNLTGLSVLNLDSTQITSLPSFSKLVNLKLIYINLTRVGDLAPLQNLPRLERIYCDHSLIKQAQAEAFVATNSKVLVVYDSKDLLNWWSELSEVWKDVLSKAASINLNPTKEELARVPKIDSINVSGLAINDVHPLQKLSKLKILQASRTSVFDLSPLAALKELTRIDISESAVKDLSPLARLPKLKTIQATKSKIENAEFNSFPALEKLYADETSFNDVTAARFLEKNPTCLLIYKTILLKEWWTTLPGSWREIFLAQEGMPQNPSMEQVHRLIETSKIIGKDASVSSLASLSEFVRLKELSLSGTALTSIVPIESLRLLKLLHITGSPLVNVESINFFIDLQDLDISNTPITDIYPIWQLSKLKKLNCAGTQVKRLDALEKLEELEYFDCSNTNVNKLESLSYLKLKTLKCFNTRISNRVIENFKAAHPECSVMYYR